MWAFIKTFLMSFNVLRSWYEQREEKRWLTPQGVLESLRNQTINGLPAPTLEPVHWKKDTWMLVRDWEFRGIFIPRFFYCNLDSVPRIPYIYSYLKGYARTAAMVHDWLYATKLYTRKHADRVFYDLMILEGVPRYLAAVIYSAVRLLGKRHYGKKHGVREALMAPEVRNADYPKEVLV